MIRKALNDMGRSGPSLHYDFTELDGWANRMVRQYGYNTLRRIAAAGIAKTPSPSLDPSYKSWAATVPIPKGEPDIPFFALQYLAHRFMKQEGFAPADQAKHESIPAQAVRKPPVVEL